VSACASVVSSGDLQPTSSSSWWSRRVEAEIVGEPDPDLDQVLELGWHTREQIEELGQSGLLTAGFEPAAIRCACQRRQRRLSLPLRHRLRAHTVALAAGVTALATLGLAIGAAGAGLARDCASGSALVSTEQATATGQVLSRCVPLAAVHEHPAEVPNVLWPPAPDRETGLTEDQSARAALQQIEEQHLSVLHEIVTTGPVAAAITGQDTAALTYLLWPLQSVSSGTVPLGGGVGYIDVFDADGHDVLVLRHHMRHEDAVQLTDPRAGTWKPVRRVLEGSVDEDGGLVPTRWGDTVVYWAAAVKQDGHLVGVVAVGDTLPQIVAQAGAQAQAAVTAYSGSGALWVSSVPGLAEGVGTQLVVSEGDAQAALHQGRTVTRTLALGPYWAVERLEPLSVLGKPVALLGVSTPRQHNEGVLGLPRALAAIAGSHPTQDCADVAMAATVESSPEIARATYRCFSPSLRDRAAAGRSEEEYVAAVAAAMPPSSGNVVVHRLESGDLLDGRKRVDFLVQGRTGQLRRAVAVFLDRQGHLTGPAQTGTSGEQDRSSGSPLAPMGRMGAPR